MILEYTKQILNTVKFTELIKQQVYGSKYSYFVQDSEHLRLHFSQDLSVEEQSDCNSFVAGFVNYTSVDQLSEYLDKTVRPFVRNLINEWAAENIAMGITQAGKTDDVLGLFTKKFPVGDENLPISLKETLDTCSLYCSLQVLGYIRQNYDHSSLSPFVTDSRLRDMMNKIEAFLGLQLSS